MEIASTILVWVGVIILLVASIWLIVRAFQESIWWGLGYLFVPFVGFIFIFAHWSTAKRPVLWLLGGSVLLLLGAYLGGQFALIR